MKQDKKKRPPVVLSEKDVEELMVKWAIEKMADDEQIGDGLDESGEVEE